MNPWIIFLLGVLIGWLLEWIIDWSYWRRKAQPEATSQNSAELEAAQKEIAELKAQLENCGEVRIDPLEKIKGIGPVIKRKLNEGGIFSFAQLGALTPAKLEEIVGEEIRRLADEDELIRQAKELAKEN
ncbi:MAG: DUF1049 domain-containing protein [Anaerolineae bacterium]|jgi:predicted flap endonuclease-1-like 5' DNA nuclease|nr:DUF1049 domain-containing protein [Anaerolineae bacterium]MBT7189909.1 DUF1049 domain-containing protein [Anaerolineae bacterium]MBT7991218.1 DUF1049 domain-containing protein [Anaerolineae bacterium]